MILTPIKRNNKLKLEIQIESRAYIMRTLCDRIDIDKQKTISQTLSFPYNARVYILRASYDSIDNKLKQKMCGKINKDITFIQFFHSTSLYSTELFKILFSLLTLQLLFYKKLVGRKKKYIANFSFTTHIQLELIGWQAYRGDQTHRKICYT